MSAEFTSQEGHFTVDPQFGESFEAQTRVDDRDESGQIREKVIAGAAILMTAVIVVPRIVDHYFGVEKEQRVEVISDTPELKKVTLMQPPICWENFEVDLTTVAKGTVSVKVKNPFKSFTLDAAWWEEGVKGEYAPMLCTDEASMEVEQTSINTVEITYPDDAPFRMFVEHTNAGDGDSLISDNSFSAGIMGAQLSIIEGLPSYGPMPDGDGIDKTKATLRNIAVTAGKELAAQACTKEAIRVSLPQLKEQIIETTRPHLEKGAELAGAELPEFNYIVNFPTDNKVTTPTTADYEAFQSQDRVKFTELPDPAELTCTSDNVIVTEEEDG